VKDKKQQEFKRQCLAELFANPPLLLGLGFGAPKVAKIFP
jgi:hypothetical protein